MENVQIGRSRNWPVYYGDGRRQNVIETIGAKKARVVVISIDKSLTSMRVALMVKKNFPDIHVCVRMRDDRYLRKLLNAGVQVIMPENLEPSLQLANSVLRGMGTPEEEAVQLIDNFRKTLSVIQSEEEDEQAA